MKRYARMAAISLVLFSNAYADLPASVQIGADEYDWQSCLTAKSNSCINACATSEDRDCQDKCMDMARDKCVTEGFTPID